VRRDPLRWDIVRAMAAGGRRTRDIADSLGWSVQHVNRVKAHVHQPQRPGPRGRRMRPDIYNFIGWYRHDHGGGATWRVVYNCQCAVKELFNLRISGDTIRRIWRESAGVNFNYAYVRGRIYHASQASLSDMIDEMAAVISPDNPDPNIVYETLRKTINRYVLGIFAVINGKAANSHYQLKFTRVMSVIPQDRRIPEDVCQVVEIWIYRLACLYKITGGSRFISYLNQYLPYKVKEAMQKHLDAVALEVHSDEIFAGDVDENCAEE
jgi:hypothetical protein